MVKMCTVYTSRHLLSFLIQAITNTAITLFVAILALFMIRTRYKLIHYIAMLISSAGAVVVILEDLNHGEGTACSITCMSLMHAILYGCILLCTCSLFLY